MKTLLLGAGASKCAGYPLTRELMSVLRNWSSANEHTNYQDDWKAWDEFRQSANGLFRLLLDDPNPEIAISALDICQLCSAAGRCGFKPDLRETATGLTLPQADLLPQQYFVTEGHQQAHRAAYVRQALLRCLQSFFVEKHANDMEPAGRSRRNYLRRLFGKLSTGDTVITLNWDTTAERTLAEEGRWNPSDGYGFRKKLQTADGAALHFSNPSEVLVLKLHGSVGWHRSDHSGLYFSGPDYLSLFEFPAEADGQQSAADPCEEPIRPTAPLLIHPSYLQVLGTAEIREIWNKAAHALSKANEVEVWGYSLPESDHAVRTLIAPLKVRLERSKVSVVVHDPDLETRRRWTKFFGSALVTDDACAESGSFKPEEEVSANPGP